MWAPRNKRGLERQLERAGAEVEAQRDSQAFSLYYPLPAELQPPGLQESPLSMLRQSPGSQAAFQACHGVIRTPSPSCTAWARTRGKALASSVLSLRLSPFLTAYNAQVAAQASQSFLESCLNQAGLKKQNIGTQVYLKIFDSHVIIF